MREGGISDRNSLGLVSVYRGKCTKHPPCWQSWFLEFCHDNCDYFFLFFFFFYVVFLCCLHQCAMTAWSWPICHLLKGGNVWIVFQAMETPYTKLGLQDQEVPLWLLGPNCRRSLAVQKARIYFFSNVIIGLWCVHRCDDTVEPGSFQALNCGFWKIVLLPWFYELALCCFSLIWKRRNSPAKAGVSSKEV